MIRRSMVIVPAAVALLLFAACGSDPTATPTPSPTPPASGGSDSTSDAGESSTFDTMIKFLKHQNIEISVGTTVVWEAELGFVDASKVPAYHTVTSGKPGDPDVGSLFDSGKIAEQDFFRYTFDQAGEFPYFCTIHPQFMRAVVKVQ